MMIYVTTTYRLIQRDTLHALSSRDKRNALRVRADANMRQWQRSSVHQPSSMVCQVVEGDWGDVTLDMTKRYGRMFAVLNMANAFRAGGGYMEGAAAQEENMFRRTVCHFSITPEHSDRARVLYLPSMTDLINGRNGRVFFDPNPRVCFRGSEKRKQSNFGYEVLDTPFLFYELRGAALDLRSPKLNFDEAETRKRIDAQLDTCMEHKVRHVILSAFGCGAFKNPALRVAAHYRAALEVPKRRNWFRVVVFAIHNPGYGPKNNFNAFRQVFAGRDSCPAQWYWRDNNQWVPYNATLNTRLQEHYMANQSRASLSATHFVDFTTMRQVRYDNPRRYRAVFKGLGSLSLPRSHHRTTQIKTMQTLEAKTAQMHIGGTPGRNSDSKRGTPSTQGTRHGRNCGYQHRPLTHAQGQRVEQVWRPQVYCQSSWLYDAAASTWPSCSPHRQARERDRSRHPFSNI
jgi:hypothetical protein